jgi:hypothetical protein
LLIWEKHQVLDQNWDCRGEGNFTALPEKRVGKFEQIFGLERGANEGSTVRTLYAATSRVSSLECMDKKQINDPKMTWNFLIWVGGVFMLSLFAFLAHFVWKIF